MTHFQVFFNWLFDGDSKTEIPKPIFRDGKEIEPDILKYNSPISNTYVIKIFMNNLKLNHYLNNNMNNINLWYIDKKELFKFMKKCVIDFKVRRNSILYVHNERKEKLFIQLKKKVPLFKNYDIDLLCDLIQDSEDKDAIYNSLGLSSKPTMKKVKQNKKKTNKTTTSNSFYENNFKVTKS